MLSEPARKETNPDFDCVEDDKRRWTQKTTVIFFAFTSMVDKSIHFSKAKCNAHKSG